MVIGVPEGIVNSFFIEEETSVVRERLEGMRGLVTFDCSMIAIEYKS